MKQKIVVKVQICCDKSRKKAMKIAASTEGVISAAIQGEEEDEIVVVGIGVDSACLCTALRKKLGHANLKSVEQVKDPKPEEKKKEEKPQKEEKKDGKEAAAIIYHHYFPDYPPPNYCYPNPPPCYIYTTQDYPPCICTIM